MIKRTGIKSIKQFPNAEPIVSMINFKDKIFVATNKRVFELKDGNGIPLTFITIPEDISK